MLISAPLWPRTTALAFDSTRGQVLLIGGLGATISNDTWAWDGSAWLRKDSAATPSTRAGAALAEDPYHHVVLLFGGSNAGDNRGDTWLWNGAWHQACPAHSPSARTGAAMTYDPVHHLMLLFGGSGMHDTWVWDGRDWIQKSPATSPPGRESARLAFDDARGNAVLYGGFAAPSDTWTWDGTNWTKQNPTRTPTSQGEATAVPQQMVYDPLRKVILFIEPIQHGKTMETWTWNGVNWTRLNPAASPPPRDGNGLAYDAKRSLIVFAGGFPYGSADPTTTWGWNGLTWSKLDGMPA